MSLKFIFTILSFCLMGDLFAQQKDSLAILQLLKDDYKTLVTLDKAAHTRNVTSDYRLIEDGQIWPLQTELDSFYAGPPDKNKSRNDHFSIKVFSMSGNMAYVVWHLHSEYFYNGSQTKEKFWNESGVFRKEKGSWKMALLHSSPAPPSFSLNGNWIPIREEFAGKELPATAFQTQRLLLTDSNYQFSAESIDKGICRYANGKMDLYGKEGVNTGKHFTCIYKLENGLLTVCYNLMGTDYPADFETKSKPALFLSVFKKTDK